MTEEQLRAWLDRYEEAFEGQDPDAAAALFTADATYQWGPFGDLLRGPAEIRAKWAQSIDPRDEDVRCDLEILAVTEDIGFARWIASFTYPEDRKVVRFDGVFAVSLSSDGCCREFREWWNSREEPLEP